MSHPVTQPIVKVVVHANIFAALYALASSVCNAGWSDSYRATVVSNDEITDLYFRDYPKAFSQARSNENLTKLWLAHITIYIWDEFKALSGQARRMLSLITFVPSRWVISACRFHGDSNLQRALARPLRGWVRDVLWMHQGI